MNICEITELVEIVVPISGLIAAIVGGYFAFVKWKLA